MPFDTHSGERLRTERERLGWTQQAMADAVGVRREMWSKYERGVAVPGGDVFEALAALRIDLMFVLTGEAASAGSFPADEQLLLEAYRSLSTQARKMLLADLLTGSKKPQTKKTQEAGIKVSGSANRVAGRDYNEK